MGSTIRLRANVKRVQDENLPEAPFKFQVRNPSAKGIRPRFRKVRQKKSDEGSSGSAGSKKGETQSTVDPSLWVKKFEPKTESILKKAA